MSHLKCFKYLLYTVLLSLVSFAMRLPVVQWFLFTNDFCILQFECTNDLKSLQKFSQIEFSNYYRK